MIDREFVIANSVIGLIPVFGLVEVVTSAKYLGDDLMHGEAWRIFSVSVLAQLVYLIIALRWLL